MWLLAAAGAEAATLNLEKNTYQFGGTATANIAIQNGENNIFLLISPEFGYFPADRVELRFAADFLLDEEAEAGFGLAAGVDYFLKGEWVAPYIGAQVGVGNRQLDETPAVLATGAEIITAGVRAGMLLPMSQTTGFDIGVRVNYNQPLQKGGSPWVSIPLGYTGVRAFFR
jgi:hypothetical protein